MTLADEVELFLKRTGLSQQELARRANISQSTISRILRRPHRRKTQALAKLVDFMQQQSITAPETSLGRAFKEIWDGSDAHEAALAKLLLASAELWPKLREGERLA